LRSVCPRPGVSEHAPGTEDLSGFGH
jgi:hypothetical protein